ncbi:MAG: hypothetical protein ACREAY_02745 [Nitrososphaera sp.]|uniref:hypothetical protein n=1 Tax=Nitrososphaera sp. TaxID=1971748 RepID=UPI003D6F1263
MEELAFRSKALQYAVGVLQAKKNKENRKELDYVINILNEKMKALEEEKREKIGVA